MFDYDRPHIAISMLRQKRIFFVGGTGKSGTTWLQLLLDAHPSVSCSGEGHFPDHLWDVLKQAMDQYKTIIGTNNKQLFNELEGYVPQQRRMCSMFLRPVSPCSWSSKASTRLRSR